MTFQEYINQGECVKRQASGSVIIEKSDCDLILNDGYNNRLIVTLELPGLLNVTYVTKDGANTLWTTDEHLNPKKRSVFAIKL